MKAFVIITGSLISILLFQIFLWMHFIRTGFLVFFLFFSTFGVNEDILVIVFPFIFATITMYLFSITYGNFNAREKLLYKISLFIGLIVAMFIIYIPHYANFTTYIVQKCNGINEYYIRIYSFGDAFPIILRYSLSVAVSLVIYAILAFFLKFTLKVSKEVSLKVDAKRGVAMLIDTIIIIGILFVLMVLIKLITMNNSSMNTFLLILINSGFWFKDCFKGNSLGKRLNGIEIIDKNTLKPASFTKRFIRNLFLTFWFIEMFVWFFNPNSRRIGDYVAETIVVQKDIDEL